MFVVAFGKGTEISLGPHHSKLQGQGPAFMGVFMGLRALWFVHESIFNPNTYHSFSLSLPGWFFLIFHYGNLYWFPTLTPDRLCTCFSTHPSVLAIFITSIMWFTLLSILICILQGSSSFVHSAWIPNHPSPFHQLGNTFSFWHKCYVFQEEVSELPQATASTFCFLQAMSFVYTSL